MQSYDVIVLGGGAAGLMCAQTAAERGRSVLVLDASNKVGKKILMSGGGRCNFTNLYVEPENFLSDNPHFCRSALSRFTQWDFIARVERHGIAYHERKHGQLFCDDSSKQILGLLLAECADAGVRIQTHCAVSSVGSGDENAERFVLQTTCGNFTARSLVVATGGLSIPKMGASGFGYTLAREFGLKVLPTRAGLVPFVFDNAFGELCERLAGVSLDGRLSCVPPAGTATRRAFAEALMFSHRGLTGPVALQLSSYWLETRAIAIDFCAELDLAQRLAASKRERPRSLLRTVLGEHLPRKLVGELENMLWPQAAARPLAEWRDAALAELANVLKNFEVRPSGTEGYRTAEVTVGGVDTEELSSRTMESRRREGLYFIGEVVDVTGHLGGFNFQWAWSSGFVAGSYA